MLEVDDLLIDVEVAPIDGLGRAVAEAGPCVLRAEDGSPVIGRMKLDAADLDSLEAAGQLEAVVLHEMGHVLGLGSLWGTLGLVGNPSLPDKPGADTHFLGKHANRAFDRVGGDTYTLGEKVPLENTAVFESADGHWRESVFGEELMSPRFDQNERLPLSQVTVAALDDLGFWQVDYDAADDYQLPASSRPRPRQQSLSGCVLRAAQAVVDRSGKVVEPMKYR